MKSPSSALIWELWWRNRWGIALLGAFLLAGALANIWVARLDARGGRLQAEFRERTRGSMSLGELQQRLEGELVPTHATIRIGPRQYTRPIAPGDQLHWTGNLAGDMSPVITVTWNEVALAEREPLFHNITVLLSDGGKRTLSFGPSMACAERAAAAWFRAQSWRNAGLSWSIASVAFSLLIVFAMFSSTEPHPKLGFTGIPPRRFALPVATWILVCWPVVLGMLVTAVLTVAWFGFVLPGLAYDKAMPVVYLASLIAAGLAVFQAMIWGLASFPKTRTMSVTFFVLGLVAMALLPFSDHGAIAQRWRTLEPFLLIAFAGIWACAVAAAWFSVNLERRGHWSGWSRPLLPAIVRTWLEARPPSFGSAWEAQFWAEWRTNGRAALLVWTFLVLALLSADFLFREHHLSSEGLLPLGFVLGMGWLIVTGLNLARDPATRRLPLSSFTAVRPVTAGTLLQAKLVLGGVLWLGAILILAAFFYVFASVGGYLGNALSEVRDIWKLLLPISLHVFVGILPFTLWGRIPGFPWSLLPMLLVYGLLVNGMQWFPRSSQYQEILFVLLVLLVAAKLIAASWSFSTAIHRGLSSIQFALGYTAVWLAATGALLWMAYGALDQSDFPTALKLIPGAVLIIPLARVAFSPLALELNRQR
ncbi:MAG: hypothetical protein AB9869_04160 [Verrucomicrobiia bacterium]